MLLRRVLNALMLIPPRSIVVGAFSLASTRFPARRCDHQLPRQRSSCFGGESVEPRNDARPLLARCSSSSSSDVLVEEFNDLPLVVGENDDDEQHAPLRPDPDLPPDEIPTRLMMALSPERVHAPHRNAGLETMWEFAGGNTRYVFDHNRTDFVESALETAAEFPTSFYGAALRGRGWTMEGGLNRVGGGHTNNDDDCWIATQVMRTVSEDGRVRRWQWELRKNRRPPDMGCWLVDSIGSSDRKGNFEADD